MTEKCGRLELKLCKVLHRKYEKKSLHPMEGLFSFYVDTALRTQRKRPAGTWAEDFIHTCPEARKEFIRDKGLHGSTETAAMDPDGTGTVQ